MLQSLFRLIAVLVVFAAMVALGYGLRMALLPPVEEQTGSDMQVICLNCGHVEIALVTDIHATFCSKCGNPVAEAWRCRDCGKVFPFVQRMPKDRAPGRRGLQDWAEMHRCPFCKSLKTEPVPLKEEEPPKPPAKKPAAVPSTPAE